MTFSVEAPGYIDCNVGFYWCKSVSFRRDEVEWIDSTITEQLISPAAQTLGVELQTIVLFWPTSEPVTPLALVEFWAT